MIKRFREPYISHLLIWIFLCFFPFITYFYEPQKIGEISTYLIKSHLVTIFFLAANFYLNLLYIAPKYFFKKKRTVFVLLVLLLWAGFVYISYLKIYFNPDEEFRRFKDLNNFFFRVVLGPTVMFSACILAGTMLFLFKEQSRQKDLNKQIEIEKTATELSMLKLQISPHFLFNTLNNIRWLVRQKSDMSEESLMRLSEILRYILYDVEGPEVEFFKEVEHIRNFIELQKLRLPVEGDITFKVDERIRNFRIEPLLFIHFVENAFKFGVNSQDAPEIRFDFEKVPGGIVFTAENKILLKQTLVKNEGIGLANARRRLDILYPGRHELKINHTEDRYKVLLKLLAGEN